MSIFKEIMTLRKTDINVAFDVAKANYEINKKNKWAHRSYAWTISDKIRIKLNKRQMDVELRTLFELYFFELDVELDDVIHGFMLRLLNEIAQEYPDIVGRVIMKYGIDQFEENDWKRVEYQGKEYLGKAEKLIQVGARYFLAYGSIEELIKYIKILKEAIDNTPHGEWLYYYCSKMLIKTNNFVEAEAFIRPIAKVKRSEYWIWKALGDIYRECGRDELAISSYCRGLICETEPKYLNLIRMNLGKLIGRKHPEVAKREFFLVYENKQKEATPMPADLQNIISSSWYVNTPISQSNADFYLEYKDLVEMHLFQDLPWIKANVGEWYSSKDDKQYLNLYFINEKKVERVSLKAKQFPFLLSAGVGDTVRFKGESRNGKNFIYICELDDDYQYNNSICFSFYGTLRIIHGSDYGFVDEVFIPKSAIQSDENFAHGVTVRGVAVKSYNIKKEKWGSVALRLYITE